jgi:dTMP kinase
MTLRKFIRLAAGETVVQSKEPTGGEHGLRLRASAQNGRMSPEEKLATFLADLREHVEKVIQPALDRGEIVILDRYFYSTIAYQGARIGEHPCGLYDQMKEFPKPDIAYLIDVDPAIGLHRIEQTRGDIPNEFERIEALTEIRELFLKLTEWAPEIRVVNGLPSIEAIYDEIMHDFVDTTLKAKRCYKPYDCDIFYCSYRIPGECTWPKERAKLLNC